MKPWLLAGLLLSGCAPHQNASVRPAARPAAPSAPAAAPASPAPEPEPSSPGAAAGCSNPQYGFRCATPPGYVLTQEGRGPGTVMTLSKRAIGSAEEADLAVRVAPLKAETLESFVQKRVARDLSRASGVGAVNQRPLALSGRSGVELLVDRTYASGPYRSRIYCFAEGGNVFIVDLTAPAARFDKENGALDFFVEHLTFTP